MRSAIQGVIFDMDGVLIDSEPWHYKAINDILARYGVNMPWDEHREYVGVKTPETFARLKKRYHLPDTVAAMAEAKTRRFLHYIQTDPDIAPIPGVPPLLADLRAHRLPLAVASSSPATIVQAVLARLDLRDTFAVVINGDMVTNGKPAPDIFLAAARRLAISPAACAVIEDAAHGVAAAKAAGMKCIGFVNPHSGHQDFSRADLVTADLRQLNYQVIQHLTGSNGYPGRANPLTIVRRLT